MSLLLRKYFSEVTPGSLIYAINPMGLNNEHKLPKPEMVEVIVKSVSKSKDQRLIKNGVYPNIIEYYRFEEQFKHFALEQRPTASIVVHGDNALILAVDKTGLPIPFASDRDVMLEFMKTK